MNKRAKKTLNMGVKLFLRLLAATILCAILYVSMNVITTVFFSDVVGYQVFEETADGNIVQVGDDYYYQPGEEHATAEKLKLNDNQVLTAIRVVPENKQAVMNVITQILLLILLGIFPYHILWAFGNRDDTNTRYRGQRTDSLRGIKVGLLAVSPYALIWLLFLISKLGVLPEVMMQAYRISAIPFYPYVNLILGSASTTQDVSWWQILAMAPALLFVPIVSGVSYRLGGNRFSFAEFITFKKTNTEVDEEI